MRGETTAGVSLATALWVLQGICRQLGCACQKKEEAFGIFPHGSCAEGGCLEVKASGNDLFPCFPWSEKDCDDEKINSECIPAQI